MPLEGDTDKNRRPGPFERKGGGGKALKGRGKGGEKIKRSPQKLDVRYGYGKKRRTKGTGPAERTIVHLGRRVPTGAMV